MGSLDGVHDAPTTGKYVPKAAKIPPNIPNTILLNLKQWINMEDQLYFLFSVGL